MTNSSPFLPQTLVGRIAAVALLAAGAACARAEAPAEPAPALVTRAAAEYVFYDVSGDTPAALRASLREGSARTLGGSHFARADWNVTWRARWEGDRTCRVGSVDVRLTARVTLPRWDPPADAAPELVARWGAFMHALSLHEARHVDIGAEAAQAVRRAVEAESNTSCAGMDSRTRAAAERALAAHREKNREYDERTRHGVTEGAVWPPRAATTPPPPR